MNTRSNIPKGIATAFGAVWDASNYTCAEACLSKELPHWIGAHVRAFVFFGCLPKVPVPDNLRAGVNQRP
jgi:transposase